MKKRLTILLTILFVCVGIYALAGPIDNTGSSILGHIHDNFREIEIVEDHFHNAEVWYGRDPGDTFLSPTSLVEWQVVAQDDGYTGTAIQLSNGDELEGGDATKYFDVHELLVTATNAANKVQKIQFLYGTNIVGDATVASEIAFFVPAAGKSTAIELFMPRIPCNNKLWVLAYSETDTATIDFIVGIHTYDR